MFCPLKIVHIFLSLKVGSGFDWWRCVKVGDSGDGVAMSMGLIRWCADGLWWFKEAMLAFGWNNGYGGEVDRSG